MSTVVERPVFLYDGDCAFCSSCARFVEDHIPTTAELTPWQHADLDRLGVSQPEAEAAVQWLAGDSPVRAGPDAIAELLVEAGRFVLPRPRRYGAAPS